MAEKFLSTLLLMFIASCYFTYTACREIEFDIVVQMTLEHVLVQRFKKKSGRKKLLLTKTCKYYKASKFR